MQFGLDDRVVLVTGGTRGIGRAVAAAFVAEGARVAVTYQADKAAADETVAALGPDRVLPVRYQIGAPGAARACLTEVLQRWGRIDVLVANAHRRGARRAPGQHVESVAEADWQPLVVDNLTDALRLCQLALADMRPRGWGRVVLVSSHHVRDGAAGQEFYAAAKAGLHGAARSMAWDAGADGILVNVVAPGLTGTEPVLTQLPERVRAHELARTPTGALVSPDAVARTVVFLGSSANAGITGETITVAGGR